jgi:hypothetical protein
MGEELAHETLLDTMMNTIAESELKYRTAMVIALVLFAGVLSALICMTPAVRAYGGSLGGIVYWIDQYGNARPMPWAQVTADNGESPPVVAYTTDGNYSMWLPEGTYDITASSSPGFYPDSKPGIVVSPGYSVSLDFELKPTGQPIPELPPWSQPLVILATLAITAVAVRRRRIRTGAD